jgi:hypothetical protein
MDDTTDVDHDTPTKISANQDNHILASMLITNKIN